MKITLRCLEDYGLTLQERAENVIVYSEPNIDKDEDILDALENQTVTLDLVDIYYEFAEMSYYLEDRHGNPLVQKGSLDEVKQAIEQYISSHKPLPSEPND